MGAIVDQPGGQQIRTTPPRDGKVPGYATLLKGHKAGWYKIGGVWVHWNGSTVIGTSKTRPQTGGGDGGGSSGGGSGGGGGGGGGGESETKALTRQFVNYYKALGLTPKMSLVNKAVKEKVTLDVFELWVRKQDTMRYVKSWRGQEELSKWRKDLHSWFPNLDDKGTKVPTGKAKQWFLQYVKKGYASFDDFVVKTNLYKEIYKRRGFEMAAYNVRQSPGTFRSYAEAYAMLKRTYLNEDPTDADYRTFFSHKITPDQFKSNVEALSIGAEPFQWSGQGKLSKQETKSLLYSGKGGEEAKARLARAYNLKKGFFEARPAEFQANRNEAGDLTMEGVFANG